MSIVAEFAKDIVKSIVPQPDTAEPPHTFRWRQTVAGMLMLLTAAQILFGVWAANQLPGTYGFASQKEVQNMQSLFHDFRETQLVEAINRTRTRQCMAIASRNQEALNSTRSDLDRLRRDYRILMGFDYTLPSCMELLIEVQ